MLLKNLLVGRSPCGWECPAPKRRVDFSNYRAVGEHAPTVEEPDMHVVFDVLPNVAQPRNARVWISPYVKSEWSEGTTAARYKRRRMKSTTDSEVVHQRQSVHRANERRIARPIVPVLWFINSRTFGSGRPNEHKEILQDRKPLCNF
jgi:hypothetical protein